MIDIKQIHFTLFVIDFLLFSVHSQQNYSGNSIFSCKNNDLHGPSPAFLYTCNGLYNTCNAFLIFKSQPPYNSIAAISNLTSSSPKELTRINKLTEFPTNKEVIVPVTCSCGEKDYYYQANTTYTTSSYDPYYTIANNTYQGLSTCDSLKRANNYGELELHPGLRLHVPLRCACPTRNQTARGTMYLLTYSVHWNDNLVGISRRFNISTQSLIDANGFSSENSVLNPFTTILIPLPNEPSVSMTVIQNEQPSDSPPPIFWDPKSKARNRKSYIGIPIAVSFLLLLVFVGIVGAILIIFRKNPEEVFKKGRKKISKWVRVTKKEIRVEIASIEHVQVYRYEEIKKATGNFNANNRLHYSVYKGVFHRKTMVVKEEKRDVSMEVSMLKAINHFNLTKLEGYCEYHGSYFLVFEYMEGGSLREWLNRNRSDGHGSSSKRIEIALDVANGLHYLHNFTEPRYIHRNISTSNILLNSNLRAKIANFSLIQPVDKFASHTKTVVGTRGYIAPEYLEVGLVSTKTDVYAFGVVLLELITGKDPIVLHDGKEVPLPEFIMSCLESNEEEVGLSVFIDTNFLETSARAFVLPLTKLSLACLTQEPDRRPSMEEVVSSLSKIHILSYGK